MTGMFQSSRMASGSPRLQTSSAFSPSSASTISKSISSRIRRAIFRMTVESSTTRHVLISAISRGGVAIATRSLSSKQGFRHDFEDAIDVEDHHELAVEAVYAAGELGHAGIEVDGVFLPAVVGKLEHFADLVDQTAIGGLPSSFLGSPRRARMSITVTMRPRRLSTPAISPGDSGTRVSRSGMNTSCTREIGRPNNWPPIMAVTYSATAPSMLSVLLLMLLSSCRPD